MSELLRLLRREDSTGTVSRSDAGDEAEEAPEVRLAVYDSPLAAPRVVSLRGQEFHEFVGELAARTYHFSHERGGRIPYVVIREVIENLIHAYFEGAVISILNEGNTIRISDQGPGITDPQKALQPGFTTATPAMRRFIKGVGSGLPVAREQLEFLGGAIAIDGNLGRGSVITLSVGPAPARSGQAAGAAAVPPELSARQKKVLLLIAELGAAGPSAIAKELGISQSTAYRELEVLDGLRLVSLKNQGKRTLTEEGVAALGGVFQP